MLLYILRGQSFSGKSVSLEELIVQFYQEKLYRGPDSGQCKQGLRQTTVSLNKARSLAMHRVFSCTLPDKETKIAL